jgi:hypothetical protein
VCREPGYARRIIVGVKRFVRVSEPGAWKPCWSNPVRHALMRELPIDVDGPYWQSWPRVRAARGLVEPIEL